MNQMSRGPVHAAQKGTMMKLTRAIACAAGLLFVPTFAAAAPTQSHEHSMAGQAQPPQGQAAKPQEMQCPMMQHMHGGMKMDGKPAPHGQDGAQPPATGNGAGNMNGMGEMKCMHGGAAATPVPQPAPSEQHNHDHPGTSKPR
jgi:hypothetical protein